MAEKDSIGDYCDYLDKEMTIMGLLTAFAVAVPAFVLDRTAGATKEHEELLRLWTDQRGMLVAGTVAFFGSALCFYLQRSYLAYFYGQLRLSCTEAKYKDWPTKRLLEDADSWATWIRYTNAFVMLTVGFVFYSIALFNPPRLTGHHRSVIAIVVTVALVVIALNWRVKYKHRYEDHPWRRHFRS